MNVNCWMLILIGMGFLVGQMAGGLIFVLWIEPRLDKSANPKNKEKDRMSRKKSGLGGHSGLVGHSGQDVR